jgi:hypothetical protein
MRSADAPGYYYYNYQYGSAPLLTASADKSLPEPSEKDPQ